MNEDSRLFVELLQAADGLPDRLFELLRQHGEFTDDISMIRVAYREDGSLVDEADALRELGNRHCAWTCARRYLPGAPHGEHARTIRGWLPGLAEN